MQYWSQRTKDVRYMYRLGSIQNPNNSLSNSHFSRPNSGREVYSLRGFSRATLVPGSQQPQYIWRVPRGLRQVAYQTSKPVSSGFVLGSYAMFSWAERIMRTSLLCHHMRPRLHMLGTRCSNTFLCTSACFLHTCHPSHLFDAINHDDQRSTATFKLYPCSQLVAIFRRTQLWNSLQSTPRASPSFLER